MKKFGTPIGAGFGLASEYDGLDGVGTPPFARGACGLRRLTVGDGCAWWLGARGFGFGFGFGFALCFDDDWDFVGCEEGFWLFGRPATLGGADFEPLPRFGVAVVVWVVVVPVVDGVVLVLVVPVVGVVEVLVVPVADSVGVVPMLVVVPSSDGVVLVLVVPVVDGVVFVLVLVVAGVVVVVVGVVFVLVVVVVEPQFSLSLTM